MSQFAQTVAAPQEFFLEAHHYREAVSVASLAALMARARIARREAVRVAQVIADVRAAALMARAREAARLELARREAARREADEFAVAKAAWHEARVRYEARIAAEEAARLDAVDEAARFETARFRAAWRKHLADEAPAREAARFETARFKAVWREHLARELAAAREEARIAAEAARKLYQPE